MKTYTVGELIEELKNIPPYVPVFGYSAMDEGDFPIQAVELTGPILEPDDTGIIRELVPHGCQADSYVEEYWNTHGKCPVVYIRNNY